MNRSYQSNGADINGAPPSGLVSGAGAALARLQSETAAELDALLPSILDKAFKGEL